VCTSDFRVVLLLRFVQGIGFGGLTPVIVTSIGSLFEGGIEAAAQGFRFASSGVVLMTLPLLGGVLVGYGWYYPFFVFGIAFPVAALFVLWFEEPTSEPSRSGGDSQETLRNLVALVRQRRGAAVLVARGIPEFLFLTFLTYNSLVVVRPIGESPTQAGLLVNVASIAHVVSATWAGRITARYESRLFPLLFANVCMGAGVALFGLVPSLPVTVVVSPAVGVGFGTTL
jgi:MFS family permease